MTRWEESLTCVKTLKTLPIHGTECLWVFRLGECKCLDRTTGRSPKARTIEMGTVVLAYDHPILAGWTSLGWWIVDENRLFVVSSLLSDNFHDVFGDP